MMPPGWSPGEVLWDQQNTVSPAADVVYMALSSDRPEVLHLLPDAAASMTLLGRGLAGFHSAISTTRAKPFEVDIKAHPT